MSKKEKPKVKKVIPKKKTGTNATCAPNAACGPIHNN
jgi:hypothetical protein